MFKLQISKDIHVELLDEHHTISLFELVIKNKNYLSPWMPWVNKTSSLKDTKYFIRNHKNRWIINEGFDCGIFYNNVLCGVIGFHEINRLHYTASIGYWIDEHHQNKYIVTSCVNKFIQLATDYYQTQLIIIQCAIHNTKSQQIPIRLGFTMDTIIPHAEYVDGQYIDYQRYIFKTRHHSSLK